MARQALVLLLIVVRPASLIAQSGHATSEPKRPEYADRRFDEDWSVLRGGNLNPADAWDRVKFIPLTKGQQAWLTLAGQVRVREEYVRQFQFGESEPAETDAYLLSRIRLSLDLHVSKHFRAFVEAKSSLATDRDLSGADSSFIDVLNVQNGFADAAFLVGEWTVTLRGGREELLFGSQRLIGPSDFSNVRRTFQGGSAIVEAGGWTVTSFWTELILVEPYGPNPASPGNKLFGVYGANNVEDSIAPELYWFGIDNEHASFNGTSGRERRQTVGARLWSDSAPAHIDVDAEGAAQFGTLGAHTILATMLTLDIGYTFDSPLEPRVFANVDFASGDGNLGGDVGTFNQLYPTNHAYLGNTDYVGRQNILSPSIGMSLKPASTLNVSVMQYGFWRASTVDALYDSGGSVLRAGTTTSARYIGAETDLVVDYQFDRHTLAYVSYNHFFPGLFIRKTGLARASDYVYAALQFTF